MLIAWLVARDYGAVVILFGAGLGAYVGSFLGAMRKVRGAHLEEGSIEHPVEPRGGRMIAVLAERPGMDARALTLLREFGARDVGRPHAHDPLKPVDPAVRLERIES